jgi:short-subunit dehydrogenase
MEARIDRERFGPWALVTGASSGIGREFARQLAASGINVVLVARRHALLEEAGQEFAKKYGVQYRAIAADLSREGFLHPIIQTTQELDIGLVVSNAGTATPGEFIKADREALVGMLRLNALAHLDIAHHFGRRLAERGRGGLVLCGAMGAAHGIPYVANDSGAKAYVQSLGESLHIELKAHNVNATVLVVGPTQTAIIDKFGLDPKDMPMKPMTTAQCVFEAFDALHRDQSSRLSGRMNRLMSALIPTSVSRRMMGKMMAKTLADKEAKLQVPAGAG